MIWGGPFVLLLTSTVVNRCKSHVVLTFPPARYPPLDFLDSSTTVGPCGVPKASYLHYTTLVAGDQYNITWRMNYVTEGGFKIAILDENGLEVKRLTPDNRSSNFVGQLTPLQQHFHVTVPDGFTCYGCAIQLEREVKEWGNKRKFRSCADVNIVKRFDDKAPIRFTRMDSGMA
uniref:Uncharacterized protein n=1 Tax=Plectus sambesii TaxID=2011161 RepID=A0A914W6B2_9BILA